MKRKEITWENVKTKKINKKLFIDFIYPHRIKDFEYEDKLLKFAVEGIAKANQTRDFSVVSHLDKLYCIVYSFDTSVYEGYTKHDVEELLKQFPDINKEKFDKALLGNTCAIVNEEIIMYKHDILTALRCGVENRDMYLWEWD